MHNLALCYAHIATPTSPRQLTHTTTKNLCFVGRFEHYQAPLVSFLAHETFETKLLSSCADSLAK